VGGRIKKWSAAMRHTCRLPSNADTSLDRTRCDCLEDAVEAWGVIRT
jgi:hypothetical protein